MFIVIEGPNGVGKTSVAQRLAEERRAAGRATTTLSQPSNSLIGRLAREREQELVGWALAALVVADRYLQLRDVIEPALASGTDIILDRYVASTLVLQRLDGLDPDVLWQMNAQALRPDLMVILQADAKTLRQRLRHRTRLSRFERVAQGPELEAQLYTEAVELLATHGYKIMTIDTTDIPLEAVVGLIHQAVKERDEA